MALSIPSLSFLFPATIDLENELLTGSHQSDLWPRQTIPKSERLRDHDPNSGRLEHHDFDRQNTSSQSASSISAGREHSVHRPIRTSHTSEPQGVLLTTDRCHQHGGLEPSGRHEKMEYVQSTSRETSDLLVTVC